MTVIPVFLVFSGLLVLLNAVLVWLGFAVAFHYHPIDWRTFAFGASLALGLALTPGHCLFVLWRALGLRKRLGHRLLFGRIIGSLLVLAGSASIFRDGGDLLLYLPTLFLGLIMLWLCHAAGRFQHQHGV